MGVRVLWDRQEDKAVWYDSITGRAFGPVFENPEEIREDAGVDELIVTAQDVATVFMGYLVAELGVARPDMLATETLMNTYAKWRTANQVPEEEQV